MSLEMHKTRMNKVVQFIEENLNDKTNIDELSQIACYSPYHFHRIFKAHVGEGVHAYKKRLLLERAATQLIYTDGSIRDISINSGYERQSSFNKAFQNEFRLSPRQYRKQNSSETSICPVSYGEKDALVVEPEYKKIEGMQLLSVRRNGKYREASTTAWQTLMQFAYQKGLFKQDTKLIGITHDFSEITDEEHIRYDACITSDYSVDVSGDLQKTQIDEGSYAVFFHHGPYEDSSRVYSYIFGTWLHQTQYQLRDEPCFSLYLDQDPRQVRPEELRTEIYIPIT